MLNIILLTVFFLVPFVIACYYRQPGGGISLNALLDRKYTTSMKGVAIIMIMLSHCTSYWGVYYTPFGSIGVSMFLLLSGYGLNESYKHHGLKNFWSRRLLRVMIPFVIAIALVTLFLERSLMWFLGNVILIYPYYWFIAFIIYCYIAFWIVSKMFKNEWRWMMLLVLGIPCFIFVNSNQAFAFTIGVLLSEYKNKIETINDSKPRALPKTGGILIILSIMLIAIKQCDIVRNGSLASLLPYIDLCISTFCSLGIILVFCINDHFHNNKFLYFTGVIAYELYLVHYPFYTIIGSQLWAMILLIVCSYFVAYIFHLANERLFGIININK